MSNRYPRFPAPSYVVVNLIAVAGHLASAVAMIYFTLDPNLCRAG
jgi:hypothetical protein